MASNATSPPTFSETQTKLIESFIRLSVDIGIANVTLQKVADHAKVAFGTVRYNFVGEKNIDLTQAAIFYILGKGQAHIERYLSKERQRPKYNAVESYVRGSMLWSKDESVEFSFLVYYYYLSTGRTKLMVENSFYLDHARSRLDSLIHEAVGRGIYVKPNNARLASMQIHSSLIGSGILAATDKRKGAFEEQLEAVLRTTDLILRKSDSPSAQTKFRKK